MAAFKGGCVFISGDARPAYTLVHCVFTPSSKSHRHISLPGIPASLTGDGGGPGGPRTGNSSGIFPGSSSGLEGSPGSRTGGGTSGRGFPGGLSCGGSVGLPGVGGGISRGSLGIYIATLRFSLLTSGCVPVASAAAILT